MVAIESSALAPPPLPSSEQEFKQSLFALRYRNRGAYLQSLALSYGDALVPLLESLLATKPAILSIPIPRLPSAEAELNADGGDPAPVVDIHSLHFPQTNASSRYFERDSGLVMANTLAQQGSKRAISLLLSNLNHPYQVGKKRLIQCLASCASDEDLLTTAADSAPAIRDALVAALVKEKRKDLANDIMGKPRNVITKDVKTPVTTRFRRALEETKEYDRDRVWAEYRSLIPVTNQPGKNICEPGESVKDTILALQETFPPLFEWDSSSPELRLPKLAPTIKDNIISFLQHDTERTIRILQKTSCQVNKLKQYYAHIPKDLYDTKKARKFWCRRESNDTLLQDYILSLITTGNGELVKAGQLPHTQIFLCCRGPVVAQLVRAALALIDAYEFKILSPAQTPNPVQRLNNILQFAVQGIDNLVHRVVGCSTIEDRARATVTFHETLRELLTLLFSTAMPALRVQHNEEDVRNSRLYNNILKPLLQVQGHLPKNGADPSHIKSFPPLGQTIFEQIRTIFKTKTRKDLSIRNLVEVLLAVLAPRDTSVYAIPGNGYKQPFSGVPAWDNSTVFQTCVVGFLNRTGKAMIKLDATWIQHFSNMAEYLTLSQRDEVVRWITALPSFKPLIDKDQGVSVFPMLEKLCTNIDLRHQIVFPLVFCDKKDKEVDLGDRIAEWAAHVDIRIPTVRALLVKEITKPAFEDRLKWFVAILNATRMAGDVKEWLLTLRWLIPKIRNEIQPNLMALSPSLLPQDTFVPRQYLDNATLEEAQELATLYLALDSQNAAAVTPVKGITRFLDSIASEAIARFANQPSHPFYHLGMEIPWRHGLTKNGELTALDRYRVKVNDPVYSSKVSERNEEGETRRRQIEAKEEEAKKTEGGPWGLSVVQEGEEEAYIQGRVKAVLLRWLSVKARIDPDVQGEDLQAFKTARKTVWQTLCQDLLSDLGWRWKKSPTLVTYLDEVLDLLAGAPTKTFGSDTVLDWELEESEEFFKFSSYYVQEVRDVYTDSDWNRANRDNLPWWSRFRDLQLRSTKYSLQVATSVEECRLQNGKRDHVRYENFVVELLKRSPSAIHLSDVKDFISKQRPDLLTDEQLAMTKGIPGVFNQVETAEPWSLIVSVPSRLDPHQCNILKARHLFGMTDSAAPFKTCVEHAQAFMMIPTTTVEDVANALCMPSLPSRIVEALLMFLPTLGEPASTLQILLAPVYIQSHLARTSIHAVENALSCVRVQQIPDFILPLFPPAGVRPQKVTVQKEGIRLVCASMRLLTDPKVSALIEDLLARDDLHNDVRVVILQSLLGLLCGREGREARYTDSCEWIWKILVGVARSDLLKKAGVAMVLLAVTASFQTQNQAPWVSTTSPTRWCLKINLTLNDLAKIVIPEGLIDRYVEEVLLPMCVLPTGEDDTDKNLVEVRVLALQLLAQTNGWITAKNAAGLAKDWREEAVKVPLDDDPDQLWALFVSGIGRCVGKEVEGAVAAHQAGNVSWQELIRLVQDQVDTFLDKTQRRTLRKKALDRIYSMNLATNFLTLNFEKARNSGSFSGDDLDLSRPLLGNAMESVMWKIALQREITVFKPQEGMTQDQINEKALGLLLRIADYSQRYLSDDLATFTYTLMSKGRDTARFLGLALMAPHKDLIDWVHLDEVAMFILGRNKERFTLADICSFVDRLANQENAYSCGTWRVQIANMISNEITRMFNRTYGKLTEGLVSSVTQTLTPLVERARSAGWVRGPDSSVLGKLMNDHMNVLCAAFPREVGPLLHNSIVNALETGESQNENLKRLHDLTIFGAEATGRSNQAVVRGQEPNTSYGIAPTSIFILETCMNGKLEELDLTRYTARHTIPVEIMYGHWFRFQGNPGQNKVVHAENKSPVTLKELDERWNSIMSDIRYAAYFKPLEQAVQLASQKSISPLLLQVYRNNAANTLTLLPKFVLLRPFVYLEFMRLTLTAPNTTFTAALAASNMAAAFATYKDSAADEFTYAWAPSLGLALDFAEHLLHEIREEAEIEGQREAQLIEQTTALFLQNWMQRTVNSRAGKLLAEAEDVKSLEARYLALVDELCEDGSGGQSVALQLGDFIPGGFNPDDAAKVDSNEEYTDSESDDYD